MFTAIKDFPYDKTKATRVNAAYYEQMLNSIKRFEDGMSELSGASPLFSLVQKEVNFVVTLNNDLKRVHTSVLKNRFNMIKTVMKHISGLSYKELLSLFPIPIHFDGSYIKPLDSGPMDSFIGSAYETLCECGIDPDEIDWDSVVGDNLKDFITSNENDCLCKFLRAYYATHDLLLKRDKELRNKYSYTDLMYNLDLLL